MNPDPAPDTFKAVFLMDGPPSLTITDLARGIVLTTITQFRAEELGPRGFHAVYMNVKLASRGYVVPEELRANTSTLLNGWTMTMDGYTTDVVRRTNERYRMVLHCGCTEWSDYPPVSTMSQCMQHPSYGRQPILRYIDRVRNVRTQIL